MANDGSFFNQMNEAAARALKTSQEIAARFKAATDAAGENFGADLYKFVEQGTDVIGRVTTPIANNPLIRFATKVPVISWLAAALGQVDVAAVQREVEELRIRHPLDTEEQLAQRVMATSAWRAAGIGLATNVIPPVAVLLFAVDLGAIAALQAEMIYRIAAIYGFSPTDASRRGEVLGLWGLSTGSSGMVKTGLSLVEIVPGLGAVIGVASDASVLYTMGYLACRFYEEKRKQAKKYDESSY